MGKSPKPNHLDSLWEIEPGVWKKLGKMTAEDCGKAKALAFERAGKDKEKAHYFERAEKDKD